jgi:hypothetical protein
MKRKMRKQTPEELARRDDLTRRLLEIIERYRALASEERRLRESS